MTNDIDNKLRRPTIPCVVAFTLLLMMLFGLLPLCNATFQRAVAAINAPLYQMDNEEGALLFQTLELRQGKNIYHSLDQPPYVVGTYPPIYPALCALFTPSVKTGFLAGRVISLLALVASAVFLAACVRSVSGTIFPAVLAFALLPAHYVTYHWVAYYRVDLLGLAFTLGGLISYLHLRRHKSGKILAVSCFVAAFFTKQTYLAAPAAVAAGMIAGRDWRSLLRFSSGFAAGIVLPFFALVIWTRGQFAVHTILYNMNQFVASDLLVYARLAWVFSGFLLIAAAVGICVLVLLIRKNSAENDSEKRENEVAVLFYCCFAFSTILLSGKSGSAENYLLEPLTAACMASCAALGTLFRTRIERNATGKGANKILAWTCLALLVIHVGKISTAPLRLYAFNAGKNPVPIDLAAASRVAAIVRAEKKDTWTELAIYNLLAGRSIHFQPFITSELARQGRWTPQPLYRDLRSGRFAVIVSNYDFSSGDYTNVYTKEMISVISQNYTLREHLKGFNWQYYVYAHVPSGG